MKVEQKILSIISETLNTPLEKIQNSDRLADLVQDSIQLFELLIRFETELGEKINYEDIIHIESIEDVILHAKLKGFGENKNNPGVLSNPILT